MEGEFPYLCFSRVGWAERGSRGALARCFRGIYNDRPSQKSKEDDEGRLQHQHPRRLLYVVTVNLQLG